MKANTMHTKHSLQRAQQRRIKIRHMELAKEYGTPTKNGWCLSRKDYQAVEKEMKAFLSELRAAVDVFVAAKCDVSITTYRATRAQQRKFFKRSAMC